MLALGLSLVASFSPTSRVWAQAAAPAETRSAEADGRVDSEAEGDAGPHGAEAPASADVGAGTRSDGPVGGPKPANAERIPPRDAAPRPAERTPGAEAAAGPDGLEPGSPRPDADASKDGLSDARAGATPPRVLEAPEPDFPEGADPAEHPTVIVHTTIGESGEVVEAHVEESVDAVFDAAAVEAVKRWRFAPAMRGGEAVVSRVRLAVHFEPPGFSQGASSPVLPGPLEEGPVTTIERSQTAATADDQDDDEATAAFAATVEAPFDHGKNARAPSEHRLDRKLLESAPRREAGDMLSSAPGFFMSRPEGGAVAGRIILRGFDAEHGQDIAFSVDGLPINQPSHIHGQGYAELGFLIPELVTHIDVLEGVYDPEQGDFAVAGSARFHLGTEKRGLQLKSGYGSFNTWRHLVLWAPEEASTGTFAAVDYQSTDGFGQNRDGSQISALLGWEGRKGRVSHRLRGGVYGARYRLAGVLRRRDIDEGRIGFFDSYPFPTAENQNAIALQAFATYRLGLHHADGGRSTFEAWAAAREFRSQQNFTGFTQVSLTNPDLRGRGDLIEQSNRQLSTGLSAVHVTRPYKPASWAVGHVRVGTDGRLDRINQTQNLVQAPQNTTWDQRIAADITGVDVGLFGEVDFAFFERLRVRAGFRGDLLLYDIDDNLGNRTPRFRRETTIDGFRRSAAGLAAGPRLSATYALIPGLDLLAAYGEGYRSPQARLLEDGESAPFTKVRSVDLGVRSSVETPIGSIASSAGFFYTHLSDDIAFEAREGRAESVGPSQRLGAQGSVRWEPLHWLFTQASLTFVRATLLSPPPPSAEDPDPPFVPGQALPFVAPWLYRQDLGARQAVGSWFGQEVTAFGGAGYTYLGSRPLPFATAAAPVHLLDARAGLEVGRVTFDLSALNLLNLQYAASEFAFPSNWTPNEQPSRLSERHIAAGPPLTLMANLGVRL